MFNFLNTIPIDPSEKLFLEIASHLRLLRTELMHNFPDIIRCTYLYMVNSLTVDLAIPLVGTGKLEEIFDLQSDEKAKTKHKECLPINFWINMFSTNPTLARNAVPQLLIFPSTWYSEQGFLAMMTTKTKSRNCLDELGHDFRCAVGGVTP